MARSQDYLKLSRSASHAGQKLNRGMGAGSCWKPFGSSELIGSSEPSGDSKSLGDREPVDGIV